MPGANYVGSAYNTLTSLLNRPIAGVASQGFDSLSSGYEGGLKKGVADLSRRGLINSGAVPDLYTNLGEEYASGTSNVTATAQSAQNQETQQILNQLLGLTSPTLAESRAQLAQREQVIGGASDITAGLFANYPSLQQQLTKGTQGYLASGLWGNPASLASQLGKVLGIP